MSARKGNKGSGESKSKNVPPSLDSLLNADSSELDGARAKQSKGQPAVKVRNLQEILEEASIGARPPSVDRIVTYSEESPASLPVQIAEARAQGQLKSSGQQQLPSLDTLLQSHEKSVDAGRPRTDARIHRAMPENLESLISRADGQNNSVESDAMPRSRGYIAVATVGLIVALVIMLFFNQHQSIPDSEVARQLLVIAEDIERYQVEHGQLPEKLSDLPRFPDSAVEWPIENYEVRLAVPQLELFFIEVPGSYLLIARFDDEVWVYDRERSQPLRRVQSDQY